MAISKCFYCYYWDGSMKNGDVWCKYYSMWHNPDKADSCFRFEPK